MSVNTTTDTSVMTNEEKGIHFFRYNPDDGSANDLSITATCLTAFRDNREAVEIARNSEYQGNWAITRATLRIIGRFPGIHLTK